MHLPDEQNIQHEQEVLLQQNTENTQNPTIRLTNITKEINSFKIL